MIYMSLQLSSCITKQGHVYNTDSMGYYFLLGT